MNLGYSAGVDDKNPQITLKMHYCYLSLYRLTDCDFSIIADSTEFILYYRTIVFQAIDSSELLFNKSMPEIQLTALTTHTEAMVGRRNSVPVHHHHVDLRGLGHETHSAPSGFEIIDKPLMSKHFLGNHEFIPE